MLGIALFQIFAAEASVLLRYNFVAWGNVILIFQKNTQHS
jgi:hypothetical protein